MPEPWEAADPRLLTDPEHLEWQKVALQTGVDYPALVKMAGQSRDFFDFARHPEVWRMARTRVTNVFHELTPKLPAAKLDVTKEGWLEDNAFTAAAKLAYNAPASLVNFAAALPSFFGGTGVDLLGMMAEGVTQSAREVYNPEDVRKYASQTTQEYNAQFVKESLRSFGGAFTSLYDAAANRGRFEEEGGWAGVTARIHEDPMGQVLLPLLIAKGGKQWALKKTGIPQGMAIAALKDGTRTVKEKLKTMAEDTSGKYKDWFKRQAQKKLAEIEAGKVQPEKEVALVEKLVEHHDKVEARLAPKVPEMVQLSEKAVSEAKEAHAVQVAEKVEAAPEPAKPIIAEHGKARQKELDRLQKKAAAGEYVQLPTPKPVRPAFIVPGAEFVAQIKPRKIEVKLERLTSAVDEIKRGNMDPQKGIAKIVAMRKLWESLAREHPEVHTAEQWEALRDGFDAARAEVAAFNKYAAEQAAQIGGEAIAETAAKSTKVTPAGKFKKAKEQHLKAIKLKDLIAMQKAGNEVLATAKEAVEAAKQEQPPTVSVTTEGAVAVKPKTPRKFGKTNTAFTADDLAAAVKAYKERPAQLGSGLGGLSPELLQMIVKAGGYLIEGGLRSFAAWSEAMIAKFGDDFREHLEQVWGSLEGFRYKQAEAYMNARARAKVKAKGGRVRTKEIDEALRRIDSKVNLNDLLESAQDKLDRKEALTPEEAKAIEYSKANPEAHIITPYEQELLRAESIYEQESAEQLSGLKPEQSLAPKGKFSIPAYQVGLETWLAGVRESKEAWSEAVRAQLEKRGIVPPRETPPVAKIKGKEPKISKADRVIDNVIRDTWDRLAPERERIGLEEAKARTDALRDRAEEASLQRIEGGAVKPWAFAGSNLAERIANRLRPGMSPADLNKVEKFILEKREDLTEADIELLRPILVEAAKDIRGRPGAIEWTEELFDRPEVEPEFVDIPEATPEEVRDAKLATLVAKFRQEHGEGKLTEIVRLKIDELGVYRDALTKPARDAIRYIEYGKGLNRKMDGLTPELIYAESLKRGTYEEGIRLLDQYMVMVADGIRDPKVREELKPMMRSIELARKLLTDISRDHKTAVARQVNDSLEKVEPKHKAEAEAEARARLESDENSDATISEALDLELHVEAQMRRIKEQEGRAGLRIDTEEGEGAGMDIRRPKSEGEAAERLGYESVKGVPLNEILDEVASLTYMVKQGIVTLEGLKSELHPSIFAKVRRAVESKREFSTMDEMREYITKQNRKIRDVSTDEGVMGIVSKGGERSRTIWENKNVLDVIREGRAPELESTKTRMDKWVSFVREGLRDTRVPRWKKTLSQFGNAFMNGFVYEWDLYDAPHALWTIDRLREFRGAGHSASVKAEVDIDNVLDPIIKNNLRIDRPDVYDAFCLDIALSDLIESWAKWRQIRTEDYVFVMEQLAAKVEAGQLGGAAEAIGMMKDLADITMATIKARGGKTEHGAPLNLQLVKEGGKLPNRMTLDDLIGIYEVFHKEAAAKPGLLEALDRHQMLVRTMGGELAARGAMSELSVRKFYLPHMIKEMFSDTPKEGGKKPLKTPWLGYTKMRKGSYLPHELDYIQAMGKTLQRFYVDEAKYRMLRDMINKHKDWTKVVDNEGHLADGYEWYDADWGVRHTMGDTTLARMVERALNANILNGKDIPKDSVQAAAFNEYRNALMKKGTVAPVPVEIAKRLDAFHDGPDKGMGNLVRAITGTWKAFVILNTLPTFLWNQVIGDMEMQARESMRSYRFLGEAAKEVFRRNWGREKITDPQTMLEWVRMHVRPEENAEQALEEWRAIDRFQVMDSGLAVGDLDLARKYRHFYRRPLTTKMAQFGKGLVQKAFQVAGTREGVSRVALYKWMTKTEEGAKHLEEHYPELVKQLAETGVRWTETTKGAEGKPSESIVRSRVIGRDITYEEVEALRAKGVKVEEFRDLTKVAAKVSRESMVDYGGLPPFEQKFLRGFLLPFYPYYRYNLTNWVKMYSSRRWFEGVLKSALPQVAMHLWNNTGWRKDEEEALAPWQREGPHIILPWLRSEDGSAYVVTFQLPSQDFQSIVRNTQDTFVRLLNPALKGLGGHIMGRDPATGFPIREGEQAGWTADQFAPLWRKLKAAQIEERTKGKLLKEEGETTSLIVRWLVNAAMPIHPKRIDKYEAQVRQGKIRRGWNAMLNEEIRAQKRFMESGRKTYDEGMATIEKLAAALQEGPPDDPKDLMGELVRIINLVSDGDFSAKSQLARWWDMEVTEQAAKSR